MNAANQPHNPDHHVALILDRFAADFHKKYAKGQIEHGGRLWRKPVLPFLVEEVLDFVSYADVIGRQHEVMKEICAEALHHPDHALAAIGMIRNILVFGNPEGVVESGD